MKAENPINEITEDDAFDAPDADYDNENNIDDGFQDEDQDSNDNDYVQDESFSIEALLLSAENPSSPEARTMSKESEELGKLELMRQKIKDEITRNMKKNMKMSSSEEIIADIFKTKVKGPRLKRRGRRKKKQPGTGLRGRTYGLKLGK